MQRRSEAADCRQATAVAEAGPVGFALRRPPFIIKKQFEYFWSFQAQWIMVVIIYGSFYVKVCRGVWECFLNFKNIFG